MNREVYQLIKEENRQKNNQVNEVRRKVLYKNAIDKHKNIKESQRLKQPKYKSNISDKVKSQIIVDYHLMQKPFVSQIDQYTHYQTTHKLTTLIVKYNNNNPLVTHTTEVYIGDIPDNLVMYIKELDGKHSDITVTCSFARHRFRAQYLFEILQGKRRADKYCTWINHFDLVKQEPDENTVSPSLSKHLSPEDLFNQFKFKCYKIQGNSDKNKPSENEIIPMQDLANSNIYVFYINNIV